MPKRRDPSNLSDSGIQSGALGLAGRPATKLELFATVFGTGAAVMVVEILGTRIIGPVFGVGLFVWSALLAVTLSSLAAGYYAGGVLIDRRPDPRLLGAVVAASGLLLGVVPVVSRTVLAFAEPLGPRGGPLLSASILFTPCLATMGMVGPIAVRLATRDLHATGHRVGSMYAVSTAGSLVGTLTTAFLLIPSFETRHILLGSAVLLVVLGIVPLVRRGYAIAAVAVLIPWLSLLRPDVALPTGITVVDRSQSMYGLVEVIDDSNRNVRFLRADHSVIGGEYIRDHSPCFAFISVLEAIRFRRPEAKDMLQIGLGTGSLPSVLRRHPVTIDVVEIDPDVVRFAQKYFQFFSEWAGFR